MRFDPRDLPPSATEFLAERHLATLTSSRADGSPHVVPVGFTWDGDNGLARVITSAGTQKAVNAARGLRVALCQLDPEQRWRWITLEGISRVVTDDEALAEAVARYAARYRVPRPNPLRVVLEVSVDRVLGLVERPGGRADGGRTDSDRTDSDRTDRPRQEAGPGPALVEGTGEDSPRGDAPSRT